MGAGTKAAAAVIAGLFIMGLINSNDNNAPNTDAPVQRVQAQDEADKVEVETSSENNEPEKPSSPWRVSESTSEIDDSPRVILSVSSSDLIRDKFGRVGRGDLVLRCLENTTVLYVNFAGNFMSDHGSYGNVTYRIDDAEARTARMRESTNHESLGLWSGGASIPVIKRMFGHDTLIVRATPYNESPVTITFPISGLSEEIKPLREACHW